MSPFVENFVKALRRPSSGFYGLLVRHSLSANKPLERNAVKLLKIKPYHNVLEVGFGPGHGIKYVFNSGFRNGNGKMFGVDFSSAVCEHAKKRFAADIRSEKLVILNEDVAKMSLPDCHFDKVFHTNSHFYWPNLDSACKELRRVMKEGADMVTVVNLLQIKHATRSSQMLKYAPNLSSDAYVEALKQSGFVDVKICEVKRRLAPTLHAIVCKKS